MEPTRFPPDTWRAVVENSADFILILEPDGSIAYVNRTAPNTTLDDVVGKSIYDFLAPDEAKQVRGACEQVVRTGESKTYEASFTNRSGVTRNFHVRTAPIPEHGEVTALAIWARDITEHQQVAERFRAQYQGLPLPTYTWQKVEDDFVLIDFNKAARTATDNRVEGLLGRKASDLYADDPDILADFNRCFTEQRALEREMAYRLRSTGEERQLQTTYAFIPPDLVMAHATDITERRQAEEALRESERSLDDLLDAAPDALVIVDADGAIVRTNSVVRAMFGYEADELLGRPVETLVPEPYRANHESLRRSVSGTAYRRPMAPVRNLHGLRKDGTEFPVDISLNSIDTSEGVRTIAAIRDVTERLLAQQALIKSEERFRLLAENAHDMIFRFNATEPPHFEYLSPASTAMLGYTPQDFYDDPSLAVQVVHPDDLDRVLESIRQRQETPVESRKVRKDGRVIWTEQVSRYMYDEQGNVVATEGIVRDITERKTAEEALQESEERYRTLVELMNEGLGMQGPDGRITFANERLASMLGYTPAELVGRPSMEVIAPTSESAYTSVRDAAMQAGSATAEFELTTKTGTTIWTRISARQLPDDEGDCAGGFAIVTDITDWKRTEAALRESEERFRVSLMHSPVVVFNQDLDLRYTWVYNPLGGLVSEDIVGKTDEDIYPPEDVGRVTALKREVLAAGVGRREETWVRVGGHVLWLDRTIEPLRDERGSIVGITGASFDITERKQGDEELQRAKEEIEGRVDQGLERGNAYDLTFRELSVLHLVVEGKTDKEIGATLGISPLTVSKHVSNILSKMDVESRTAAGAQAIREGLVS